LTQAIDPVTRFGDLESPKHLLGVADDGQLVLDTCFGVSRGVLVVALLIFFYLYSFISGYRKGNLSSVVVPLESRRSDEHR
jgi:hypothetical protein